MTDTRDTIADTIAKALAERIIRGHIAPGEKLRQDHIAEEFKTSHVPVREAFRRLEAQGLALGEPRRGVRVSSFSRAEMKEVAEMRAALESLALRHAAPNITPAILREAEKWTQQSEAAVDAEAWEYANWQFHRTILEPCHMPRLLQTIEDLHSASARFLFSGWRAEWEAPTDRDHRAVLEALRKDHSDLAASILARHVQWNRH